MTLQSKQWFRTFNQAMNLLIAKRISKQKFDKVLINHIRYSRVK